jgi:hypothetical protein
MFGAGEKGGFARVNPKGKVLMVEPEPPTKP